MNKKHSLHLVWSGRHEREPIDSELVRVESYGGSTERDACGTLIHADNFAALHALKKKYSQKVRLIYIDPPFFTGKKFRHRIDPEEAGQPRKSSHAYDDFSGLCIDDYLQMLYERLPLMRDLLTTDGSIYVHTDWHASHFIRLLLDEVFGADYFQNEIVWCYSEAINSKKRWNRKHDLIYLYSRGRDFVFNYREVLEQHSESTLRKYRKEDEKGRYRLMGRGITGSPIRSARDISPEWEATHPELTFRHYLPEGRLPSDYWKIDIVNQASAERTGYGTQKPVALLEKILLASSNPGDLVADFFRGSGTLAVAAKKLGRSWIACDNSPAAISVARRRLVGDSDQESTVDLLKLKNEPLEFSDSKHGFSLNKAGGNVSVSISGLGETELRKVVFWAVDPGYDGKVFRPEWWSCTKKGMGIAVKSPSISMGGSGRIIVLVSYSDATDCFLELD